LVSGPVRAALAQPVFSLCLPIQPNGRPLNTCAPGLIPSHPMSCDPLVKTPTDSHSKALLGFFYF
jgi:hypothetical protein